MDMRTEHMISGKMPNPVRRNIMIGTVMLATLSAGLLLATNLRAQVPTASAQGSWTIRAPLPSACGEVAAVALDGKLHAIGGSVDGKGRPFHDEYDPATNTWRARASLPEARDHLALAVAAGRYLRSVASPQQCTKAPAPMRSNTIQQRTLADVAAHESGARLSRRRNGRRQNSCDRRTRPRTRSSSRRTKCLIQKPHMERSCAVAHGARPHGCRRL